MQGVAAVVDDGGLVLGGSQSGSALVGGEGIVVARAFVGTIAGVDLTPGGAAATGAEQQREDSTSPSRPRRPGVLPPAERVPATSRTARVSDVSECSSSRSRPAPMNQGKRSVATCSSAPSNVVCRRQTRRRARRRFRGCARSRRSPRRCGRGCRARGWHARGRVRRRRAWAGGHHHSARLGAGGDGVDTDAGIARPAQRKVELTSDVLAVRRPQSPVSPRRPRRPACRARSRWPVRGPCPDRPGWPRPGHA